MSDTPTSAGLGSLDDMPSDVSNPLGDIANTAQRNLPRATTDPSGRTVTTTYDGYGQPVCAQVATGDAGTATNRWSCIDAYDDMLRVTQSTTRSPDGSAAQTLATDYWGSSNDPLTTMTTDKGTAVSLAQKVNWTGSLVDYTDGIGTQTAYAYDNMGRSQTQTITLPSGSQGGPYSYESAYDLTTGLAVSTSLDGAPLVDIARNSVTAQYPRTRGPWRQDPPGLS